ncbi:transcriptional regulator with XRE-family HTH domain [Actinoplanes octamycinicus]|uniref:Transcriptional regulator with XRE-family HTH domain n=1 Tax=Actinoplanes octamycinicus TaxID=135948 RepID=A0A7W7GYE5_9ACTN|nr:helix-turn-helix transcriptional regulator [Actinoplanes octamycinicus]MBB4740594.1 transcriptional regulator with XRE-family HTH domain [Actinoplanes octamycinicus]GIE63105.1 transcriptional regulator [Actinoplanes octamycinicus]
MAEEHDGGGSTVRRLQVGAHLRALRLSRGLSREQAGYVIRASESKISRMELGRVGFKERDIVDLLKLYGVVDQAEHDRLVALAREANAPSWWQAYGDVLDTWFQNYLDLEQAAELIRTYEVQFVPGLLQTDAYARAVIRLGHGSARPEEIDLRAGLRMERKKLLDRPDAPRLWAVLDEAVLRRPIGGREVLREQIATLIEVCESPSVRLQIMPFQSGGHAAAGGAFSILRFPHEELPDVVYIEHLTSALYLDKREEVDHYAAAIGRLFIEAEPPAETPKLLTHILSELDAGRI